MRNDLSCSYRHFSYPISRQFYSLETMFFSAIFWRSIAWVNLVGKCMMQVDEFDVYALASAMSSSPSLLFWQLLHWPSLKNSEREKARGKLKYFPSRGRRRRDKRWVFRSIHLFVTLYYYNTLSKTQCLKFAAKSLIALIISVSFEFSCQNSNFYKLVLHAIL